MLDPVACANKGLPCRRLVLACSLLALLAGCVQRRLIVRSNPPGARVVVDDTYEMGVTPVAFNYTYYGTRKIKLVRDGYETMTVYQYIPPPWYQYPGLDFITENLIPWEIRDERVVQFQLIPQAVVPTEQVLRRAEELRRQAHGGKLPSPASAAATSPRSSAPGPSGPVAPGLPVPGTGAPRPVPAAPAASPPSTPSAPGPPGGPATSAPNPYLPPGGFSPRGASSGGP